MARGRSTERGSSGSQDRGRSKSQRRKNFKCYSCGMRGHYKRECWNNKRNGEKTSEASTSQGCVASTSDDGEILYSGAAISSKGGNALNDGWIVDSGATWHMTPRKDWFCTYEPISEGSVFMGNDHTLEVLGIGTIKIKTDDGTIRKIQGVRHVKDLKKNLLSIGQLDDLGCKIHTEGGNLKVVKGNLVVMKAEKLTNNLYMLVGDTLQDANALTAVASQEETTMICRNVV
jgi:hypothetical protein